MALLTMDLGVAHTCNFVGQFDSFRTDVVSRGRQLDTANTHILCRKVILRFFHINNVSWTQVIIFVPTATERYGYTIECYALETLTPPHGTRPPVMGSLPSGHAFDGPI